MVALANPAHEKDLITVASAIAHQTNGEVLAIHIVQVPDQTPLEAGAEYLDRLDAESRELLATARTDAETFGVPVTTRNIISRYSFRSIFSTARTHDVDLVVTGWSDDAHLSPGRAERGVDDLTQDLPCDFLVLKGNGFDASRILVPTAGGPDSKLSAEIARLLKAEYNSEITLLHVVDGDKEAEKGRQFLTRWATEQHLNTIETKIDTSGDIEDAIASAAREHTMVIIGATEQGLLTRLIHGSLTFDIVESLDMPVLLAERPHERSWKERILGVQT
jgi:nucleotide-binding universal stress UspA family protein